MPYTRVLQNDDPEAKCLDGSAPYLYIHEGGHKNKFLIWFQGGGICQGSSAPEIFADCIARSKTFEGSSNFTAEETTIFNGGYLSTDRQKNKFAKWTKIIIGYCDSFLHQGFRKDPIMVNG